ncbi:MSP1-like protein [Elsinoe fawcettii]|nr:MSP1-like protein [Elsinoe fawcettii]
MAHPTDASPIQCNGTGSESSPKVMYKVNWADKDGTTIRVFETLKPFPKLALSKESDTPKTANAIEKEGEGDLETGIEVILEITGRSSVGPPTEYGKVQTVKDIAISDIRSQRIIVRSQPLLAVIRHVVGYYPAQPLSGPSVTFDEPYRALLHHHSELNNIYQNLDQVDLTEYDGGLEEARAQLGTLLQLLQPYADQLLRRLEKQLGGKRPVIAHKDLWYVYKPGSDVYYEDRRDGCDGTRVVESVEYDEDDDEITLRMWSLESDGDIVSRESIRRDILPYKGELEIHRLEWRPASICDRLDGGEMRRTAIRDGKTAWSLLRAGSRYMSYRGKPLIFKDALKDALSDEDKHLQEAPEKSLPDDRGEVIVDLKSHQRYSGAGTDFTAGWTWLERRIRDKEPRWQGYQDISIKETVELSDHQYFLLEKYLPGFVIKSKSWYLFRVDQYTDDLAHDFRPGEGLVIAEDRLRMLHAVCGPTSSGLRLDFIESKGEASVILLHGPPGVGKTFTVETFAKSSARPLIQLSAADVGLSDEGLGLKLIKWFAVAEAWNAIVLIDEAEVFMEQRSRNDVKRNALVTVFLRQLEYFRGTLFLTTNRIGNIDDAFLSRVTVAIGYDELNEDSRSKIWKGFFAKLKTDMDARPKRSSTGIGSTGSTGDTKDDVIEVDHYACQYVLQDDEVKALRWNGREIRNALSTAIALARYQKVKDPESARKGYVDVNKEHFEQVVKMSQGFKRYMYSITSRDEAARAKARFERNDVIKAI